MKISVIGSGNVATHLGKAFYASGHEIAEIWSPSPGHAETLARQLDARAASRLSELDHRIDLCLIAIKDDAIEEVVRELNFRESIVVHTAGSVSMEVLSQSAPAYGVLYPFQTFSKFRQPDISRVPFCLEANNQLTLKRLAELTGSIQGKVYEVNSEGRKALHLAAVFACNFSNHLYALAEELLREKNLPYDLLEPLIMETAEKALEAAPFDAQTGPALRNDKKVMDHHLHLLEDKPALKALYQMLSASIINMHQKPTI